MVHLPGTALTRGEVLPGTPFSHAASGRETRAWDFRGREALVLAFLHDACEACESFARALASRDADVRAAGGRAFAVHAGEARSALPTLVDAGGRAATRFLGPAGELPTVVVADRYAAAWESYPVLAHAFPAVEEVVGDLWHLATMCEECGIIAWE